MLQVHNNNELSAQIREWKLQGKTIAFVPTMGNLHEGHLSLLHIGHEQADKLVSSIFVNPLQFDSNDDLGKYPRTLELDCKALMEHQCDLVYLPGVHDLYPEGMSHMTSIQVPDVTQGLEGEYRSGHLSGVSTIVLKLFNLVQPDIAIFGKKDYQQLQMLKKMVKDLNLNVDIIAGETVREENGIAMSSRNQYLSENELKIAVKLQQQLAQVANEIRTTDRPYSVLQKNSIELLNQSGFKVDYFDICHQQTLNPATSKDPKVILAAVKLGNTRLIDNIEI